MRGNRTRQAIAATRQLVARACERTLLFIDDEINFDPAISITIQKYWCRFFTSSAESLSLIWQMYPVVMCVMVAGYTDHQAVAGTGRDGVIFATVTKPSDEEELVAAIGEGIEELEVKRIAAHGFRRCCLFKQSIRGTPAFPEA